MSKSVETIAKSLKLKAEPKPDALTFRMGVKKHTLPFEVRYLASNDFLFVHIPPSAAIMKITPEGLKPVESPDEAQRAVVSFRQARKRNARRVSKVAMPTELVEALSKVPPGFKITYGPDGKPRLVKSRKRTKKS